MIDVMFLFPIGWLLAVAIPTIFERVPEFITKLRLLRGLHPVDDVDIAVTLDDYETYGIIAYILSTLYFSGFLIMIVSL